MIRAGLVVLLLTALSGQAGAQALDTVPRPLARAGSAAPVAAATPAESGPAIDASASIASGPVTSDAVAPLAPAARPAARPFFVLVTGARATGRPLAPASAPPLLPLPLTAAQGPGPLAPVWPGVTLAGIAPGPLAVLAPISPPTGRLAGHEVRLRSGARVSVDVGRLSRLFAASQFAPLRLTRPEVILPEEALLSAAVPAMERPDLRPRPRPVASAMPRPDTRPQARPDRPVQAMATPLAVPGPYVAFAAPLTSPLATPVALRPPTRPAGITQAYQAARAERVRGSVCGNPDIQGQAVAPMGSGGCYLANPVRVSSVSGISLSRPAVMDCPTAEALNTWVTRGAAPAVAGTGGGIASVQVIGGYACRTRNNAPGARLSEHAKGRAIDIAGIVLSNGNELSVLRDWGRGAAGDMLRAMHRAACGPFGTVLGPNANAAHRDHFHFDTARYRSGSYCR